MNGLRLSGPAVQPSRRMTLPLLGDGVAFEASAEVMPQTKPPASTTAAIEQDPTVQGQVCASHQGPPDRPACAAPGPRRPASPSPHAALGHEPIVYGSPPPTREASWRGPTGRGPHASRGRRACLAHRPLICWRERGRTRCGFLHSHARSGARSAVSAGRGHGATGLVLSREQAGLLPAQGRQRAAHHRPRRVVQLRAVSHHAGQPGTAPAAQGQGLRSPRSSSRRRRST